MSKMNRLSSQTMIIVDRDRRLTMAVESSRSQSSVTVTSQLERNQSMIPNKNKTTMKKKKNKNMETMSQLSSSSSLSTVSPPVVDTSSLDCCESELQKTKLSPRSEQKKTVRWTDSTLSRWTSEEVSATKRYSQGSPAKPIRTSDSPLLHPAAGDSTDSPLHFQKSTDYCEDVHHHHHHHGPSSVLPSVHNLHLQVPTMARSISLVELSSTSSSSFEDSDMGAKGAATTAMISLYGYVIDDESDFDGDTPYLCSPQNSIRAMKEVSPRSYFRKRGVVLQNDFSCDTMSTTTVSLV
jgi:hypothetical protein